MTALVHGATAATDASAAADILFGADPVRASREAFDVVSHEVETVSVTTDDLLDTVAVLVRSGLAVSNSDARRSLQQKAMKANGSVLDDENALSNTPLLHGRYILLRKGKPPIDCLISGNKSFVNPCGSRVVRVPLKAIR